MSKVRRPTAPNATLFTMDWWHERAPVRAFGVAFRLGMRGAFQPGGLTDAERDALRTIAAGVVVAGLECIDRKAARDALAAPWLR